jgi:hypothetical protein
MNTTKIITMLGCVLLGAGKLTAEGFHLEATGLRSGFSASRFKEHFYQVEAFSRLDTPCHLELGRRWRLRTGMEFTAGMLGRDDNRGFIGTFGPVFTLGRESFPFELIGGSSGTYLSRDEFGGIRFGIPFQFTSHIGVNLGLSQHWKASYRFQHMSNASISPHNPGLDLHALSLGYFF